MLVTKHAAELCALLVNDFFGELPSRILVALFTKGRCTMPQLVYQTALSPRHLRNGLGVLIQQNLLYHHTDPDTRTTSYEANSHACYNLVRSGKILDIIESRYGLAERDLVQTLMQLGSARVADLADAFTSRALKINGQASGSHEPSIGLIASKERLNSALARLIRADILETVRADSFRNPSEVYREIDAEITKTAPGERASKNKIEQHLQIAEKFKSFRDQSKALKRQLDQSFGFAAKRRRLQDGSGQNGHAAFGEAPEMSPHIVVRVNHEKCLVELRNQRLASFAADALGEVTGHIYRTLLDLLTIEVSRCRADPLISDQTPSPENPVTTLEIFEHLEDDVNVQAGIGKAEKDRIDIASAEKIRSGPYSYNSDSDEDAEDEDEPNKVGAFAPPGRIASGAALDSDVDSDDDNDTKDHPPSVNGNGQPRVKFEDGAIPRGATSRESRLDQMRNHLLLLAESKHRFVRHCGNLNRGQWAVDFDTLMDRLRESELDAFIEQSFGRHGLRLTRILREKGKLDEKMLPSAALMKKSDVQKKMLAMQMAGLVDVQEVPKDNSRLANRTMFFWFFDGERTRAQLLDDVYKGMLRCLQTLDVSRYKERYILSFVERKDVKGKEEEVMTTEPYNKYNQHLEEQQKLLGQVMRLDDMVAVFRDY